MDFKSLYLAANGRLGQKDFWIGWLILFVVSLILGTLTMGFPVVKDAISLVLLYPFYCILAKRFQDFGKTGRLALVPVVISALISLWGLLVAIGVLGAMATGDPTVAAGAMAGLFGGGALVIIGGIVSIGFVLWAGLAKGDPGPNAYGPPPAPIFGGASATPA